MPLGHYLHSSKKPFPVLGHVKFPALELAIYL